MKMKANTALPAESLLKTASPSLTLPETKELANVPAAAVMQTQTTAVPAKPISIILRRPIFSTK
jgi:Tfp pilus assembly protein FimV